MMTVKRTLTRVLSIRYPVSSYTADRLAAAITTPTSDTSLRNQAAGMSPIPNYLRNSPPPPSPSLSPFSFLISLPSSLSALHPSNFSPSLHPFPLSLFHSPTVTHSVTIYCDRWYKFDDGDVTECRMDDDEELKKECFGGEYTGEVFDHMLKRSVRTAALGALSLAVLPC